MFQSLKKALAATVLTTLIATTAIADQPIYGNVTAKDMGVLLGGTMILGSEIGADRHSANTATLRASFYAADGRSFNCNSWDGFIDPKTGETRWKPVVIDNKFAKERYPLIEVEAADGTSYGLLRYDGTTGAFDHHASIRGRWKHISTGHIQSDIPAAVYAMCPDFPSAESLGTRVNTKQTSTNYRAMVAQDPGKRVLRPDLVTDVTVEKY